MKNKTLLDNVYYDIKNPSSLASVKKLIEATKKKKKTVKKYLTQQKVYTLHKQVRKNFPRRKVISNGISDQYQADLCDMQKLAPFNNNYKYLLCVIDVFSKVAFVRSCKNKSSSEVTIAFLDILKSSQITPKKLQTDEDTSFLSREFQKLLKKYNIHFFVTNSILKASIVERFNRTLKEKIYKYLTAFNTNRYIDVLQIIVESYNNSFHRTIKMTPNQVSSENQEEVWHNIYNKDYSFVKLQKKKPKFKITDTVRISKYSNIFKKGYLPNFTQEVFIIKRVNSTTPFTYNLSDLNDEPIIGSFYEQELQHFFITKQTQYNIEKIKKHKGSFRLVSWQGYGEAFDSWIHKNEIKKIK